MTIRQLRQNRGWSQEQLAEVAGLSVRTVQRSEKGQTVGAESLKAIAAVLEVDLAQLHVAQASDETLVADTSAEEQAARQHVKAVKSFYSHLLSYTGVMVLLLLINVFTYSGYWWVVWPALGWGIGVVSHAARAFDLIDLFGADWEKRAIEKRLNKP
ncbi:2TM domain-containing protein [Neptunomonas marina]|uniref:Helix-turn-helix domain-containing protein n=1 Tax=Neptunomonas marina TaxID=1815562 RepID=A0A437Q986_9GAMM|nr:2TM domain-containing protein [Neptunomonas marina]RVU31141.1 helix-turn-helix domain-containing protein [Neptunomonas marina]